MVSRRDLLKMSGVAAASSAVTIGSTGNVAAVEVDCPNLDYDSVDEYEEHHKIDRDTNKEYDRVYDVDTEHSAVVEYCHSIDCANTVSSICGDGYLHNFVITGVGRKTKHNDDSPPDTGWGNVGEHSVYVRNQNNVKRVEFGTSSVKGVSPPPEGHEDIWEEAEEYLNETLVEFAADVITTGSTHIGWAAFAGKWVTVAMNSIAGDSVNFNYSGDTPSEVAHQIGVGVYTSTPVADFTLGSRTDSTQVQFDVHTYKDFANVSVATR